MFGRAGALFSALSALCPPLISLHCCCCVFEVETSEQQLGLLLAEAHFLLLSHQCSHLWAVAKRSRLQFTEQERDDRLGFFVFFVIHPLI